MQNIGPGPLNGALKGVQREAKRGLITTVGYKLGDRPACYALEGSIKIAGAAITWLRDNLQLIENYEECDELVNKTTNTAGVFFVPALGGLYSPYWDPNAAGVYIGLSQFSRREHLVRATLDSIAFQTNDILSLMRGVSSDLMIDGGVCKSDNLCQILADITGCDIVRPAMCETSALGAAMVAACGAGLWSYESMFADSRVPVNFYGFSSSQSGNIHHHHPHESLNYEGKFPLHTQMPIDSCKNRAQSQSKPELLNAEIGVNDDAGGGELFNFDAGGGRGEEDLELESTAFTMEADSDQCLTEYCEDQLNPSASLYGATSSGYSSGDNLDRNSMINSHQRQDSPELDPSQIEHQTDRSEPTSRCDQFNGSAELASHQPEKPVDVFQPYISLEHRTDLVATWHRAVERSMNWTKIHHEEVKRLDYQRLSSLPVSVYLFCSLGMMALSEIFSD